jgi:regulatory protein
LERAGYLAEEIEEACARLEADGYLDDMAFATSRLRRRQEQGRGARVIAAELRQKGVAPEVIDTVLAERDEDVEVARAQVLAAKLVRQRAGEPPAQRRDHVLGALLRRGYTHWVARRALEIANRGEAED